MVSPLMQGLLLHLLHPVQPDQLMLGELPARGLETLRDRLSEEEEEEEEEEEVGGQAGLVVALPQLI